MKRGMVFGGMILAAMLAFELFNYTTTDFALSDLLGDLRFLGLRWATILAIAFCGIDFAGIARLFTPERERGEQAENWYLMAAWFLAATMNAMLTWWGVSLALLSHDSLGNEILGREALLAIVPVFVAILVWVIRILLIGMISMAGDRIFSYLEDSGTPEAAHVPQARPPAEAGRLPMPMATWGGQVKQGAVARPLRGADGHGMSRPLTVAEKHGYGHMTQPNHRPASPPPPANFRPAPKPSSANPPRAGNGSGHYDFDEG